MPNLMSHLKKVAEQKPQATYYNVDMIKYQVTFREHLMCLAVVGLPFSFFFDLILSGVCFEL